MHADHIRRWSCIVIWSQPCVHAVHTARPHSLSFPASFSKTSKNHKYCSGSSYKVFCKVEVIDRLSLSRYRSHVNIRCKWGLLYQQYPTLKPNQQFDFYLFMALLRLGSLMIEHWTWIENVDKILQDLKGVKERLASTPINPPSALQDKWSI